jgi:hypothetical protein
MHDAGYDLAEAPKTWWLLATKKPKPFADIPIPDEPIYAYLVLGLVWRNPALQ